MLDDLRVALRRLRNARGFTLTAVVTLAVAVGANTAIFTVADAVLFRPLPYAEPDRLFLLRIVWPDGTRSSDVPYEYVQILQQHHTGIEGIALRSTPTFTSQPTPDGAEWVETFTAAPDYFDLLGVKPWRGRLFAVADAPDGPARAVLSYDTWRSKFGGDETVIGTEQRLGSSRRLVVGVLPPGFIFPSASLLFRDRPTGRVAFATTAEPPSKGWTRKTRNMLIRGGLAVDAIVRLKPSVTLEQAQLQMNALLENVPPPQPRYADRVVVLEDVRSVVFPKGRQALVLLLACAGLVLLIGCANLANMLLARTHRVSRDLAIRSALGAGRLRLMRPVLIEALLIGAAAAAIALAATVAFQQTLLREVPPAAYGRAFVRVDMRVAIFAFAIGAGSGVLFALAPAWRSARLDVMFLLKRGSAGGSGAAFGRSMIALQVAIAVVLFTGALAAVISLRAVLTAPRGYDATSVLMADATPGPEVKNLRMFYERVADRLVQRPEVIAVSAADRTPFDGIRTAERVVQPQTALIWHLVLPGYFELLGMRVREGRLPNRHDVSFEPVVLSVSAADRLFPGRFPVGEVVDAPMDRKGTVIAVVDDEHSYGELVGPSAYFVPREPRNAMTLLVKTRTESAEVLEGIRREIVSMVPPTEPVLTRWMRDAIGDLDSYRRPRFQTVVLGSFAVLALALAWLGIAAIVAAYVAARTRELGIRLAVGARPRDIVRAVTRDTAQAIAAGVLIGAVGCYVVQRIALTQMMDFDPVTPATLAAAVLGVTVVGLLAASLPASRAGRVDPLVVLRSE